MGKQLSILIKPASSLCNLRCRYCFYSDVSESRTVASTGIMTDETCEILIKRIAEELEGNGTANISFQGGEPTMAGLDYFRNFIKRMNGYPEIETHYSIQTNGTMVDKEWAEFFKENSFLVGVSLDGYQTNMDKFRYDPLKRGVFYKVLHCIDELDRAGVEYNILTVVTSELAKHPGALFKFLSAHNFNYVQLIPCLPGLNDEENDMALTPELFLSFYKEFFNSWNHNYLNGSDVMNVNLFENLAGMLKGYPPYQCGMLGVCSIQFVIEANGDVYPCDFYCLDEYLLGNIRYASFVEMRNSPNALKFLSSENCKKKPCETCKYIRICNGGCRRQNICYLKDDHCAYQKLLDYIVPIIYRYIQTDNP